MITLSIIFMGLVMTYLCEVLEGKRENSEDPWSDCLYVFLPPIWIFWPFILLGHIPMLWDETKGLILRREIGSPERPGLHEAYYQKVMEIQAPPYHQIKAWTPEECEALGINDTIRFIDQTERELNRLSWEIFKDEPDISVLR